MFLNISVIKFLKLFLLLLNDMYFHIIYTIIYLVLKRYVDIRVHFRIQKNKFPPDDAIRVVMQKLGLSKNNPEEVLLF